MTNRELSGMWRYAVSKKFQLNMKRISLKILCQKIDPLTNSNHGQCGTFDLNGDCPFHYKANPGDKIHMGDCLAPNVDPEWFKMVKPSRGDIGVIGCYILPYCLTGYKRYQNIKAWKRRSLSVFK